MAGALFLLGRAGKPGASTGFRSLFAFWMGGAGYDQAATPEPEVATRGGYDYIPQKRSKRKERHEERDDIRALLAKALRDDAPEAEAVAEIAAPFVRGRPTVATLKIDWHGMSARMDALQSALAAYETHLREEAARREQDDEDDLLMLLMAL